MGAFFIVGTLLLSTALLDVVFSSRQPGRKAEADTRKVLFPPSPPKTPKVQKAPGGSPKLQTHSKLPVRNRNDRDSPVQSAGPIPSPVGRQKSANVWTEFITLANKYADVNLGQGFPNTPMSSRLAQRLKEIASHPERVDYHQYARGFGHIPLVKALAKFYSPLLDHEIDPMDEVLTTVGAYLALYYSFMGWINKGDEVIIFEPAYDSYVEQIKMAGGIPVPVVLKFKPHKNSDGFLTSASFRLNVEELRAKVTKNTKMIVINNPHNPTGKLYTRQELEAIAEIVRANPQLLVVSDEVYEFHIYPPNEMVRFASLPGMFDRTITIGSAGKAFSITGWKIGWVLAPAKFIQPMRNIHENCVYTTPSPTQEAVASEFEYERDLYLRRDPRSYLYSGMVNELLPKRQRMAEELKRAGFRPIIPDAGYFMMADFRKIDGPYRSEPDDLDKDYTALDYKFVRWLCKRHKLATIPPSAFLSMANRPGNDHYVRICFYKDNTTLDGGIKILRNLTAIDDGSAIRALSRSRSSSSRTFSTRSLSRSLTANNLSERMKNGQRTEHKRKKP